MNLVALDKESNIVLKLILVDNIVNLRDLLNSVLSGKLQCCIIKPSLLVGSLQVAVAANKAILAEKSGKLKTRSIYTEILFNLSPSKYITQALQTFGVTEADNCCVVATIEKENEDRASNIELQGDVLDFSDISKFGDVDLIKKIYKIPQEELLVSSLIDSVVSRIATKDLDLHW